MSAPILVSHLIVRLDTGGAEKSLYRLLRKSQPELVHRVICIGEPSAVGRDIEALGIQVAYLNSSVFNPVGLVRLWRLLRGAPPQVLQGWMYLGNLLASLVALGLPRSVQVAWNVRSSLEDLSQERGRVRWVVQVSKFCQPALLIYNSHAGAQKHAELGFKGNAQCVIPNGIDLEEFMPSDERRTRLRRQHGLDGQFWVGMVGRFHPVKGIEPFIEAAGLMVKSHKNLRFFLAGPGMQADNTALLGMLAAHDMQAHVDLLGVVSDPAQLYPAMDMLVLASLREGTPNVLLEAMASGVYSVATDVGDVARVIGDAARLVIPNNPQDLADKIEQGLQTCAVEQDQTPQRIARQQQEREQLAQRYSQEQCFAAYVQAYADAVHAGTKGGDTGA